MSFFSNLKTFQITISNLSVLLYVTADKVEKQYAIQTTITHCNPLHTYIHSSIRKDEKKVMQ